MVNPTSSSYMVETLLVYIADPALHLHIAEMLLKPGLTLTIGRQAGVDLLVNEDSVSRHHAQIHCTTNGHYLVSDLGSMNGTYLNDVRLEPQQPYALKAQDILRFGNIVRFRCLARSLFPGIPVTRVEHEECRAVLGTDSSLHTPTERIESVRTPLDETDFFAPAMARALKEIPALIIMANSQEQLKKVPQVYLLNTDNRVSLGRDTGNDVVLEDGRVSRRHAEIVQMNDGFYIRDLLSTSGVQINEGKIKQPYRLSHGDRIVLGQTTIFFVDLQSGRESTARVVAPHPILKELPARTEQRKARPIPTKKVTVNSSNGKTPRVSVMLCQQCGIANMPSARFCAGCSQLLRANRIVE